MDPEKPGAHEGSKPGQQTVQDRRPHPHNVKRNPPPRRPEDATGINPGSKHPIDPRSPYLPPA